MEDLLMNKAVEYGVFVVLFIYLFVDTRKESKQREEKLMSHIEKSDAHIEKSDETLITVTNGIAGKLDTLDNKITFIQKDVEDLKNNK